MSALGADAAVRIVVQDASTAESLPFASLALTGPRGKTATAMTDANGAASLDLAAGQWTATATMVGYQAEKQTFTIPTSQTIVIRLTGSDNQLREVVVTAKESRGPTSASLIDRQAMAHLQPSSFSDLLELVPGNMSVDPNPGEVNTIKLREASNASDNQNYATSSLGTAFVVDGVPMNTSANLQTSLDDSRANRSAVGRGVDMRQLSTDDIEKVEIVRGIASVEYGEMTSGLVNIKRKQGATRLEARFKADSKSQLFYAGKGFALPGDRGSINLNVDYLDSKVDPRNNRENFKRVTAGVRSLLKWTHGWGITSWQSSLSYSGMRELDNNDPDLTINGTIDYYRSHQDEATFNNTLNFATPTHPFFKNITLTEGLTYGYSKVHQEKTVAPSRIYPLAISTQPGDHYVDFLPMLYLAELDVVGKPLTAFIKGATQAEWNAGILENRLKVGVEWQFSKNYGDGQVYDMARPIVASNNRRPRAFSDIPAMHQLSAYAENSSRFSLGLHRFDLQLGVRYTQLLHLDSRYALNGKPYFDPRANLQWTLPHVDIAGAPLQIELAGGYGLMTKMPVAAYLYPDLLYTDQVQLNYYHNEAAYRTMNVRTFVEDLTNYDLLAARNHKWETRVDLSYLGNRLSVTYFRENMRGGFRQTPYVSFYRYMTYDATAFDPYAANRAPLIDDLVGAPITKLATPSQWSNGSRTYKQGVEFTLSTRRFPVVRTRLTVTGAWLRTTLNNSQPLWYHPTVILNGAELPYAGLYADTDGTKYESFNTNFTFDTDVPRLGLNFSVAVQNMWYTKQQALRRATTPISYIDAEGQIHPFSDACLDDPYLSQLVRQWSDATYDVRRVPIATMFNIKATKSLWQKRINIALYVNRLVSITPDYYQYGNLIRRYTSPYFGMEVNLKI